MIKKNIFITAPPSSGKTTVIKKVIQKLSVPAKGFFTEEERVDQRRVGFLMQTLDGKKGYLAHQDIASEHHIRRYGVSLENIETIAIPAITPNGESVIILDEIGKMECFSSQFMEAAKKALDSPKIVVGTITLGGTDFILEIKQRKDLEIIELSLDNRDALPEIIINKVNQLLRDQNG